MGGKMILKDVQRSTNQVVTVAQIKKPFVTKGYKKALDV